MLDTVTVLMAVSETSHILGLIPSTTVMKVMVMVMVMAMMVMAMAMMVMVMAMSMMFMAVASSAFPVLPFAT